VSTSPDTDAKPLWQLGLDHLLEANGDGTHALDRERVVSMARGMRMVGENPPYRAVSAYIGKLWDVWPYAASMTRDGWRSAYRSRTSIGRAKRWHSPLYWPDYLIEKHGLVPRTEERLIGVATLALEALGGALNADATTYVSRRRQLDAAITSLEHLRYLRTGTDESIGRRDLNPRHPQRPRRW
jgi:hypothetical protein